MDSSTKSRTLPSSNTEVGGIKKIQKDAAHIKSQEVENHNTGVRVSEYLICTIVQGAIKFPVAAEKRVLGPSLDISTDTTGPISVISLATGTYITHHLFYNMVSIP